MSNRDMENYTDRALLVLAGETQKAVEAAERVRLVVKAVAQRRGVIRAEPRYVRDDYCQD